MLAQRSHRRRVQRQRPAALGGLGLGDDDLVVDDHPRPARRDAAGVQVDVDPAQPGDLTAPHARGGQQQPRRVQRVATHLIQEGAELLGTPDAHLRRHPLGQVGHGGNVAREVAPADGVSERGMQHAMDVSDALGSQPTAPVPPAVVQQRPVERGEVARHEPLQ
jgi:hypothetical protein